MVVATRLVYLPDENSPHGRPELDLDLAVAPGYMLFFSCFMGDFEFSLDGVELGTDFGWVSTLGFGLSFFKVVSEIPEDGDAELDFQEDPQWIRFQRRSGEVRVTCSYREGEAVVTYGDLLDISSAGLNQLVDDLHGRFPALKKNRALQNALQQVGIVP